MTKECVRDGGSSGDRVSVFQNRYHVVFFDDPVSRAWIELEEIRTFFKKDIEPMLVRIAPVLGLVILVLCLCSKIRRLHVARIPYPYHMTPRSVDKASACACSRDGDCHCLQRKVKSTFMKDMQVAVRQVKEALTLSNKDRLHRFSFSKRYKGRWAEWTDDQVEISVSEGSGTSRVAAPRQHPVQRRGLTHTSCAVTPDTKYTTITSHVTVFVIFFSWLFVEEESSEEETVIRKKRRKEKKRVRSEDESDAERERRKKKRKHDRERERDRDEKVGCSDKAARACVCVCVCVCVFE